MVLDKFQGEGGKNISANTTRLTYLSLILNEKSFYVQYTPIINYVIFICNTF